MPFFYHLTTGIGIIIHKCGQFVKVKPGGHLFTSDHLAPAPANHPMLRKIGGIASYADKEYIRAGYPGTGQGWPPRP